MKSFVKACILATLTLVPSLAMLPSFAGAAVLRPDITVSHEIVTLGDLFAGAGDLAGKPVYRAPDLGITGTIPVTDVLQRAVKLGLSDIEPGQVSQVVIRRATRTHDADEQASLIRKAVAVQSQMSADDLQVTFFATPDPIYSDPRNTTPIYLSSMTYAPENGRFTAVIAFDRDGIPDNVTLSGTVAQMRDAVVLAHPVGRGDIIAPGDVVRQKVDSRRLRDDAAVDLQAVVGQEAKRALRTGDIAFASDFDNPQLVKRGDLVSVIFRRGGMVLTGRGRAQQAGAKGDVINILNEQSKRVIQAAVSGPGEVMIDGGTAKLAAN